MPAPAPPPPSAVAVAALADHLTAAAAEGRLGAVRELVDAGVPIDAFDARGATALLAAVRGGQEEVAAWLLERGADPYRACLLHEPDLKAVVPIVHVQKEPVSASLKDLVVRAGLAIPRSDARVLRFAALFGALDLIERCLAAGADPNAPDDTGETAVMKAAALGHEAATARLLQAGGRLQPSGGPGR